MIANDILFAAIVFSEFLVFGDSCKRLVYFIGDYYIFIRVADETLLRTFLESHSLVNLGCSSILRVEGSLSGGLLPSSKQLIFIPSQPEAR